MPSTDSAVIIGRATPWFHKRWLFAVFFTLGSAAWFAYDGAIGYPKQNEIARAFEQFKEDKREDDWAAYARQRDWPDAKNIPKLKSPESIRTQVYIGAVAGVIGLGVLGSFLYRRGKVLKVDAENLYTPGGKTVPFTSIQHVDTALWADKGLARVHYLVDGTIRQAVIDGLSYGGFAGEKPYRADQILERVLAHAPKSPPAEDTASDPTSGKARGEEAT
ncbi:MAG TPA: hypothetical protein PKM43_19715 [Verrucomicrobiota bacterium]|nr:hypothetical protein [Verrucomicrobiota bacterium]HRZ36736.1 hypothetical protein [Candidatus Paceibacterota bacterium]HRZ57546.1 hypothetical protein [Candidatus Paceibacterota bacterium]